MSSKKEEERNEKIIRGLMKLPPNRKCINCNSLGPQYVCTNFWTFVCTPCSGIHREFTHRVKSVSMAKFTTQEVEALQKGGNQLARENFLTNWDMQRMRFPNSSNPDKVREFIKDVYIDKKYAGRKSSGKPPREMESFKNHELEQRRASSYHSFSQSPPYDYQYEERRYGKQFGTLNRKPGSEQGHYDVKMNSSVYSPGRLHMQAYEDRFANESSGSRMSDCSVSSAGDTFKYDGQSQNSQELGYCSPTLRQTRDTIEDARPQKLNQLTESIVKRDLDNVSSPKRTLSAGTFGSMSSRDVTVKPVLPNETHHAKASALASSTQSSGSFPGGNDAFSSSLMQQPKASVPSVDLFADFSKQPPSSAVNVVMEPVYSGGTQRVNTPAFSSMQSFASVHTAHKDPIGSTFGEQLGTSSPVDLFDNFNSQYSSTIHIEHKSAEVSMTQNEGWATFDLPHHVKVDSSLKPGIPTSDLSGSAMQGSVGVLTSLQNNSASFPDQKSMASGVLPVALNQWQLDLKGHSQPLQQNDSLLWNAFDTSSEKLAETSAHGLPLNGRPWIFASESALHDLHVKQTVSENNNDGFQNFALNAVTPSFGQTMGGVAELTFSPMVEPFMGGVSIAQKSTNPFDQPYEAHMDSMNTFLDMSSLEAALPSTQLTNDYFAGASQPWYPQNAATTFVSSFPEGEVQGVPMQGRSTHYVNFTPQGHGASVDKNPFA
ncbi:probable ADP-ribosylation factor GTPase-activating protein AGD14 isoform X1 [Zingiber officinale]|uniref:probable ADP-ribosylation factor GTPase-activating protein AGD14 isoform X1 n=1 Tax=Zingiber officinale TaxID=94328 RepID=UPI001C4C3D63|nr:probable ADP-ribosylation factor GTPase-activating protein AGD14 isoform X1 [Zingiber officinale]